ncbi:MAG: polysaccharide deacetylase family protein [Candidatus Omnitrophica bacterium]|nr:polysaccharide deacetylase family protein [Candidatus Omnitrophota bacterium]
MKNTSLMIFLTFDLEEWPVSGKYDFDQKFNKSVEFSTQGCLNLLDLLDAYKVKATFFITGYFAKANPKIVKLLADKGHEIACHAFDHVDITKDSPEQIEAHINQSKKILSDLSGQKIIGFRAPFFHANGIIVQILEQSGFHYDSSVHPAIVPGYYYNFRDSLAPYFLKAKINPEGNQAKGIWEIPVSVIPGIRFPISWWWMRHLGAWITILGCKINLIQKRPVVLYFHPWEFAELPKIKGIPGHITSKCGKQNLLKLKKVIAAFSGKYKFDTLKSYLDNNLAKGKK